MSFLAPWVFGSMAQSAIKGVVKTNDAVAPFVTVVLCSDSDTLRAQTNFEGEYAFFDVDDGEYLIYPESLGCKYLLLIEKVILNKTILTQNFILKSNGLNYEISECTVNKPHTKDVIKVDYGNIRFHFSFKNARKQKRYYRKISKQGYESAQIQGEEVLYDASSTELRKALENANPCDSYLYCKKHKNLFKTK